MKFRITPKVPKDKSKWHKWFAWHPVVAVDHDNISHIVWLETVDTKVTKTINWELGSDWQGQRRVTNTNEYKIRDTHFYG